MNTFANPKYKVLVVDDDVDLNTTFALLLEFDGHEVRTAYTGEVALAMIEKIKFDLIIIEYWLPQMKGDELAAIIKQKWPDQSIIITTANVEGLKQNSHPIAGVDFFLNKPFSLSQLREAMVALLDLSAENQQNDMGTRRIDEGHLETTARNKPIADGDR